MQYARKKVNKSFAYPVKSATHIPARASSSFDSEFTLASRTLWDRRCPRMSLVHLAITTLLTLAGLSTLQPHVPPAICPYSQEAMLCKHDLLYHVYSSTNVWNLVTQALRAVSYCKFTSAARFNVRVHFYFCDVTLIGSLKLSVSLRFVISWTGSIKQRAPHYRSGCATLLTCDMARRSRSVFRFKYKLLLFPARKSSLR